MRKFTPLKRNCPICQGTRRDCRQNKQNSIVHCRANLNVVPLGWKTLGQDKWGFEMYAPTSDEQSLEDWQQRQQEQQAQRQRELEELRRGALPEAERDEAIRRIHRHFGISQKHRQNLRDRGLCDAHIDRLPYFSFAPNQPVPQFTPANLPGLRCGKLAVKESGFACPIPNAGGIIIGWQNRFDDATNGKYRWPSGEKSAHLANGELPVGVYRPDSGVTCRAIGHTEGFLKADIIAQVWGLPTLGAASANFAGSPEQWRVSLDKLSTELGTKEVRWFADAGSVKNPTVVQIYQQAWEKLTQWGYSVKVVWYGQIEKSIGDADEISQEVRESARVITIDEYLAIACCHGGIKEKPSSHTQSIQPLGKTQDRPISRDEWELKFGVGAQVLKRLKRLTSWRKSVEASNGELPPIPPATQPTLTYRPDKSLPTPEEWAGRIPPKIIFKQGQRLEVISQIKKLGWKFVCDRSFMGQGKSHDAGSLYPDPNGTNKIWYFDQNHTNPSTETVEGMTNMPPRHNGMVAVEGKVTPRGNPHLRWAKSVVGGICAAKTAIATNGTNTTDEVPMVASLCHNSELFVKLKQKGYNVDVEKSTVKDEDGKARERNPICKGCRFAGKCHQEIGDGYGYLFARREAMESRRIRASLDSAPNPGDYEYGEDIAFVEEASRYLRGTQTLSARRQELSQLWDYVERKAPVAFAALQPVRFALVDALEGKFDRIEKGFNRGANHESLITSLPNPEDFANLPELLQQVAQAMPKVKDLVEEPDSVTGLGGKWRSIGQLARNTFKAEAARQTQQNIEALPPNILVDTLQIWAGLKPGALRVSAKQLHVTVPDSRHADVLASCEFVCLLDATGDKRQLAQMLGVASNTIIEIEQEKPNLTNLTVINVNMEGMGSKRISDTCKARQKALLEWVNRQHDEGEVRVLANLADTHLPKSGWWFNDNRSTNTFKGVGAIAAFNTPRINLGAAEDEYRTLYGSLGGFQEYYQNLIRAEIVQLVGRQRTHLYPNKNFTIYLVGTNQDVSYLHEYGIRVVGKEASELCPEAGTPAQVTRWKILEAVRHLRDQGEKVTQQAIATIADVSQPLIAKIASQFGGWKRFSKLLLALLDPLYRGSNNFAGLSDEQKDLVRNYLSPVVEFSAEATLQAQTPEGVEQNMAAVATAVMRCVELLGFCRFLEAVRQFMPAQSQANLLCVLLRGVPGVLEGFA